MISRFLRSPRSVVYWSFRSRSHRPSIVQRCFSAQDDYPTVIDVDASNLEDVVMVKSFGVATVLQCYAEWCGPCKVLAPIIEEKVIAANGRLRLATFEIDRDDDHKTMAARLGVQSIPAVMGIVQGKMVDQFTGHVPDERIDEFLDNLLAVKLEVAAPAPNTAVDDNDPAALQAAGYQALRTGNFADATKYLEAVLRLEAVDAENRAAQNKKKTSLQEKNVLEEQAAVAFAGLAQVKLAQQLGDDAKEVVAAMKSKSKWRKYEAVPQVSQAWAAVELFTDAAIQSGAVAELESHVAQHNDDLESRYSLAITLVSENSLERAMDEALQIVRLDRSWQEGKAQKLLLNVFALLGSDHPDTKEGRKRLSNYLF